MGVGAGYSPYAKWSTDSDFGPFNYLSSEESNSAFVWQFLIGYAWNDRNSIVFEMNGSIFGSDFEEYYAEDVNIQFVFFGPSWYCYFGPPGRSFFVNAGFGLTGYGDTDNLGTGRGLGYLFGGGYEFAKQVQLAASVSGARTTDCRGRVDVGTLRFSLTLSIVAY
jgi:hypothetical protein